MNTVILVVDVVMDQKLLIVPAVMKEHIFVTMELVEIAQQHTIQMIQIGHVNHVTQPVAIVMDQKLLIAQIVAMKLPDFT